LLLLFVVIDGTRVRALAQQQSSVETTARERALQLYRQGDMDAAIKALRAVVEKNQGDVVALDHLALALTSKGKKKEARKVLEQASYLHLRLYLKEFSAVSDTPDRASITRIKASHKATSDTVRAYLATEPSGYDKIGWSDTLDRLNYQGEVLELAEKMVAQGKSFQWSKEPKTKIRILSKPEPKMTKEARQGFKPGTVILQAVFAADGIIKEVKIIQELGSGLTEQSIDAAYQIKFVPATEGGRPVSRYYRIEYNFGAITPTMYEH
jgi:tetratricopeptide (TPR) repeat protein